MSMYNLPFVCDSLISNAKAAASSKCLAKQNTVISLSMCSTIYTNVYTGLITACSMNNIIYT